MTTNLKSITASRDELDAEVRMRRMAQQRLGQTLTELQRSNKDLEQFAYVASHDLQEPLRKIHAFSDLLVRECEEALPGDGPMYLEHILTATRRMQNLINDLLTFSRVATRAKPFKTTDLNDIAATVVSDLQSRIDETGGKVEILSLPVLEADPTQMAQLLQNLIGNALKFHKADEGSEVRVYSENGTDGSCRLCVSDNGIGLDTKYRDRIFMVFQRLHARGAYDGSGIGLAVCRRIVERHGGELTVESTPGEGATFIAQLPLAHPEARAEEEENDERR
jgi:light-regulated signal transduction histidine kinase (bacteriophytochrome)